MNKVILVGRLCADVERKELPSGSVKADFRLAVDRRKKDDGADFISCVAWGKLADILAQYTAKGNRVGIIGRMSTRDYTDNNGVKRYVTEVIADDIELFFESKHDTAATTAIDPEPRKPVIKPEDLKLEIDPELPF